MARQAAEKFTCPECGNKQPMTKNAQRSITCLGCDTAFAIVKDDEGGKALVPFFNQKNDTISE